MCQLLLTASVTATLCLLLIALVTGKAKFPASLERRNYLRLACLRILNPFCYYLVLSGYGRHPVRVLREAVRDGHYLYLVTRRVFGPFTATSILRFRSIDFPARHHRQQLLRIADVFRRVLEQVPVKKDEIDGLARLGSAGAVRCMSSDETEGYLEGHSIFSALKTQCSLS